MLAIETEDLWKRFRLYREKRPELKSALLRGGRGRYDDFWAIKGVGLAIPAGQSIGIIGRNGSGKSTLLKLLARILSPTRGRLAVRGKMATLLELGAGFQPDYTGLENIFLNGAILGLDRSQLRQRVGPITDFAELERFINNPVRNYSSGMYMRLGFAIAVHVDADILLIDEVLAVGDEAFQRKCLARIRELRREGRTMVLVSHDLAAVADTCDRVIWVEEGRIAADGPSQLVIQAYLDRVGALAAGATADGEGGPESAAVLHAVRFENGQKQQAVNFETGSSLSVQIEFEFRRALPEPYLGVAFFRADGVYCYGANTRLDGQPIDGRPHRGSLEWRCESLPLLPGSYQVSVGIFSGLDEQLVMRDRAYPIRVYSDRGDHGVMLIPHRWSVKS